MFLIQKDNLLKEYGERVAVHKNLVIKAGLTALSETIYDEIPLLRKYKYVPDLSPEDRSDYVIYTMSKKELDTLYEILWDRVGKYLD